MEPKVKTRPAESNGKSGEKQERTIVYSYYRLPTKVVIEVKPPPADTFGNRGIIFPDTVTAITYDVTYKRSGPPPDNFLQQISRSKNNSGVYRYGGQIICSITSGDMIFYGVATCSLSDHFCYKTGMELALSRALADEMQYNSGTL